MDLPLVRVVLVSVCIHVGDALEVLRGMPVASVQCVVTSPPYWGLRAYKGDAGMIGLEPTFDAHLTALVAVFREVRRVLRADGTCWLNYGDAYAGGGRRKEGDTPEYVGGLSGKSKGTFGSRPMPLCGYKPKDLMMMPARVALALQADGWWLRSEIVWHKPNPMPESVTDRPTSAHEKLYLLTKAPRYFYDAEAVRVPSAPASEQRYAADAPRRGRRAPEAGDTDGIGGTLAAANLRNVWSISTHSFSSAHFATFPPALVEPCIKAGTSERGACAKCGAPWRRVVKASGGAVGSSWHDHSDDLGRGQNSGGPNLESNRGNGPYARETTGWEPTCVCPDDVFAKGAPARPTLPCVVLDPFGGAGTVGLVADRLQRDAILIEISAEYAEMARKRIQADATLLAQVEVVA